jgi:glutamyl/glutaminyl-tRNA synthetase
MTAVGRLAPTPSGHLHLGNVVAFGAAWLSARAAGGRVLLRIEDVDQARARASVARQQRADLQWLGLDWDEEVPPQSARDYAPLLDVLAHRVYRCTCTRRMIREAGGIYPGTCRTAGHDTGSWRFRLDEGPTPFVDRRWGVQRVSPGTLGDPVLRRRDGVFAYPLAVVADDLVDGVTEVVRGSDLLPFTAVQVQLWEALGATPPTWLHSPIILGPDGHKLSKSHGSSHVGLLREAGWTPRDVWRLVLPWLGLSGDDLAAAVPDFDPRAGPRGPVVLDLPEEGVPDPSTGLSWRSG